MINNESIDLQRGGKEEEEKPIEITEEVEKEEGTSLDSITTPYKPSDIRIDTLPMNVGDLMEMIGAEWIKFDAEYQRKQNLWSNEKQSRLIESILLGLRLPAFYFEEVSRRQWNIIDGLQRCCTIYNFCIGKTLKLSGLEFLGDTFNEKRYDDFSFEVRRDFRMLPITVHLLAKGTPIPVKYILFKRLNTGGITLKPQEIRTAMFPDLVPILKSMSESPDFIRVTKCKIPTMRQEDKDFVSRFIAFYLLGYENYEPNMDIDTFVNKAMQKLQNELSSIHNINKMKDDFSRALQISEEIFGDDAFRKRMKRNEPRKPINKAYFEVLTTTFARLDDIQVDYLIQKKELFKDNLMVLMQRQKFVNSISTGTGMISSVQTRFKGVEEAIKATLKGTTMEMNDANETPLE